jgi:predicted amidohydrolase
MKAAVLFRTVLPAVLVAARAFADQPSEPSEEKQDVVKVAAVQISGYDKTDVPRPGYDPAESIAGYIRRAAEDGAGLVVFPEYVLGRVSVPGPATERISRAAAAGRIYVVVGCWEVYPDGSFANTALVFDRAGKILGRYHKTHAAVDHYEGKPAWSRPPSGKDTEWFIRNDPEWIMNRGDDLPVFDLDFGRVGILTCYDGWFPETFRVLSLKGAEILVWINGRRGRVEDFIVKSAMFQNHVAVIATNQAYGSGTMIADWPTRILAHCPEKKEDYITASIHLSRLRRTRVLSRNFRQRRPELYEEIVRPLSGSSQRAGATR